MDPVLSIGAYVIGMIITIAMIVSCLCVPRPAGGKRGPRALTLILIAAFAALASQPVIGTLLNDGPARLFFMRYGNVWIGFIFYTAGFLILIYPPAWIVMRGRFAGAKRLKRTILAVCLAVGTSLFIYGSFHAVSTKVRHLDITIDKSAGEVKDLKVALIADLHLSVNSRIETTRRMVRLINEQEPDVVLIAGDIFTSTYAGLRGADRYAAELREIKSRYGTFMVYGNHDLEEDLFCGFPTTPIAQAFRPPEMDKFFSDCGFTVLADEVVSIAGGEVQICGRLDGEKAGDGTAFRKSPGELLTGVDKTKPVIVLQHEPVEFALIKEAGGDLALCGHTHDGQIFPGNLIVPLFNENGYGYKNVGGLETVVTSGVGFYGPPMRVGTDSEIMVIDLHFK